MPKRKRMIEPATTLLTDAAIPVDSELAELVHVIATQFKGDTSAFFASRIQSQSSQDSDDVETLEQCLVRWFRKGAD